MSDTKRLGYRADKNAFKVMQGNGDADARSYNRESRMLLQLRRREDSKLQDKIVVNSKSINRVELQGRVGTVRLSPCVGAVAATFSLVTEHHLKSVSGVAIVESTWHNIATFEGGDVSLDGLSRGALVHLTGRLRTSKYTAADGTERIFTEVVADSLQVLEEEIQ